MSTLRECLDLVLRGQDLSRRQVRSALDVIMAGDANALQVAGLLAGLRAKGETYDELAGLAESMRRHAMKLEVPATDRPVVDTCGTGGDGASTINISTAAAFVAAAGGAMVAKHGNRSISSKCGSADVLEALGVNLNLDVAGVQRCLSEASIGFLFAPHHHPAMKHVMPVRRALGVRTAFNLLGPMTNPAGARRQVIGVFDAAYTEVVARALGALGSAHVLVVCGDDGAGGVLDEISTCGPTVGHELRDGEVRPISITTDELGLPMADVRALKGGDAAQNAAALESVLAGEPGPRGDAVAANAGAALYVAGLASTLREGVDAARDLLASGAPATILNALRAASQGA